MVLFSNAIHCSNDQRWICIIKNCVRQFLTKFSFSFKRRRRGEGRREQASGKGEGEAEGGKQTSFQWFSVLCCALAEREISCTADLQHCAPYQRTGQCAIDISKSRHCSHFRLIPAGKRYGTLHAPPHHSPATPSWK